MERGPDTIQNPLPAEGAHGHAPALEGVSGRLRLDVSGSPVGSIEIHEGEVTFHRGDGAKVDAVAACDSFETLHAITDGVLNPVVASLQNRFEIGGNRWFGIRVVLGLLGSSPLRDRAKEH
jgi:hypothetical protein